MPLFDTVLSVSLMNEPMQIYYNLLSDYHIGGTGDVGCITTSIDIAADIDTDDGDGL